MPPGTNPAFEKQLPETTGHQMPSSSRMWKLGGDTGFKGKEWGESPKVPYSVQGRCAGILSPLLSWGENTGLVRESA